MKLCNWLRHKWRQLILMLVLGVGVLGAGLYWSMRSYQISLQRQEVVIAKVSAADFTNDPVKMSKSGKLRVFYYMAGGVTDRLVKVRVGGQTAERVMEMETYWDTGIEVKAGDEVGLRFFEGKDFSVEASGWVDPNTDNTCGLGSSRREPLERLATFLEENGGEDAEKIMCWTDNELPNGLTLDFNDFQAVLGYTSGSVDDDDEDDSGDESKFVIRSFRDSDHDGEWDEGEKPLGLQVWYDYQIDDGGWSGYSTDGETGWGAAITAKDGDEVGIRRRVLAGWESSRGLDVREEVSGDGTDYFDFGYYPEGEVVSENGGFPTQPNTGVSSWLTGAMVMGLVGFLVIKLKML